MDTLYLNNAFLLEDEDINILDFFDIDNLIYGNLLAEKNVNSMNVKMEITSSNGSVEELENDNLSDVSLDYSTMIEKHVGNCNVPACGSISQRNGISSSSDMNEVDKTYTTMKNVLINNDKNSNLNGSAEEFENSSLNGSAEEFENSSINGSTEENEIDDLPDVYLEFSTMIETSNFESTDSISKKDSHSKADMNKKKKTLTMSQKPLLPPCRICKSLASGFHYGVNTCEACKGFFRRCLKKVPSVCAKSEKCIIDGRKNQCSGCRYKKCSAEGMSNQAIKKGRYTHEKRANNIREFKGEKIDTTVESLRTKNNALQMDSVSSTSSPNLHSLIPVPSDLAKFQEQSDYVINILTNAFHQTTFFTPEFFAQLPMSESICLKRRQNDLTSKIAYEKVYGTVLKTLPHNDYMDVLNNTGIQIDDRLQFIKENIIDIVLPTMKEHIIFCESIPGMSNLSLADKKKLIKVSSMPCWFIRSHQSVNAEKRLYTNEKGITFHEEDMCRIGFSTFITDFFDYVEKIQKLALTEIEIALIQAFIIFSYDEDLILSKQTSIYQDKLLNALRLYLHYEYSLGSHLRFASIIGLLTELRTAHHNYSIVQKGIHDITIHLDMPDTLKTFWFQHMS